MIASQDWCPDGVLFFQSDAIEFTAERSVDSPRDKGEMCGSAGSFLVEQLDTQTIFWWFRDSMMASVLILVMAPLIMPAHQNSVWIWLITIWVERGEMIAYPQLIQTEGNREEVEQFCLNAFALWTKWNGSGGRSENRKDWLLTSFGTSNTTINPQGNNQCHGMPTWNNLSRTSVLQIQQSSSW